MAIEAFACRVGCGACCIAPSISSPIPGMPSGKLAGQRCVQLDASNACRLFGMPDRPSVCLQFKAGPVHCGDSAEQAHEYLAHIECITSPARNE